MGPGLAPEGGLSLLLGPRSLPGNVGVVVIVRASLNQVAELCWGDPTSACLVKHVEDDIQVALSRHSSGLP